MGKKLMKKRICAQYARILFLDNGIFVTEVCAHTARSMRAVSKLEWEIMSYKKYKKWDFHQNLINYTKI